MSDDAKREAYRHVARLLRDDARQQAGQLRVGLERIADAMALAGGRAASVEDEPFDASVFERPPKPNGAQK